MVFYSYLYDQLKAERRAAWEAKYKAAKAEGVKIGRAQSAIKVAELRLKLARLERDYGIAPSQNDMAVALAEIGVSIARLNCKNQIYPSKEQIDAELADLDPRIEALNRKRDAWLAESGSD